MMQGLLNFVREKIPFALTGLVATGINYGVYLLLVDRFLPPGPATLIAYSSSVVLNFFLQRHFVFELRRSLRSAFVLSMGVSAVGLGLDWLIVTGLHVYPLFGHEEWIIKGVATALVFFYNFYAKRRVFEGSPRRNGGAGAGATPLRERARNANTKCSAGDLVQTSDPRFEDVLDVPAGPGPSSSPEDSPLTDQRTQ